MRLWRGRRLCVQPLARLDIDESIAERLRRAAEARGVLVREAADSAIIAALDREERNATKRLRTRAGRAIVQLSCMYGQLEGWGELWPAG